MIQYKEISTIAARESVYPERRVILPKLTTASEGSPEHWDWARKNWWMINYDVFMDDKEEAMRLALELDKAFTKDPEHPCIAPIIARLKVLGVKPYNELTALEVWTRCGYQLVDYCGGYNIHEAITRDLRKFSGEVLEAMCGHISYFDESPERTVTALDYCEVSLERYPYPSRRRIVCDLDQLGDGVSLPFFKDGQFDSVSICFGYKYPERMTPILKEFKRILKAGGILSFVEGDYHGYDHLFKRKFSQTAVHMILRANGYRNVLTKKIHIPNSKGMVGCIYHTEATT